MIKRCPQSRESHATSGQTPAEKGIAEKKVTREKNTALGRNFPRHVTIAGQHTRRSNPEAAGDSTLNFFVILQRNNQHIDMDGIDQLTSRGHQLAPEVLMVSAHHQIDVILVDGIQQYLAQIAAPA